MSTPIYCELHARSAFSFLRAASTPEALARRAGELGLPALAMCDRDNVAGAVRLYAAAREAGFKPILGAELTLTDGAVLTLLVASRTGYQNLCRLLTRAKLRAPKGEAAIGLDELPEFAAGLHALTGDAEGAVQRALARGDLAAAEAAARTLVRLFGPDGVHVELQRHHLRSERWTNARLLELAQALRLPVVATNGVCHALPEQRMALDVLTCARLHTHLDAAGRALTPNGERHLKSPAEMRALFADLPTAVDESARLAERLSFTLDDLGYEFPRHPVPPGESMDSYLRHLTYTGARRRYGEITVPVRRQLERELQLIAQLGFPGYFLCVWDLIEFCRRGDILVQGRGSAANSAVCYALGITAVDPIGGKLLFERFLSEGRKGWPDIDLDLPSGDRRERVIQYVYERYGRRGAAMTANVITYRGRLAAREIGKALHFPEDQLARFSALFGHGDYPHTLAFAEQMRQAGLTQSNPRVEAFLRCYQQIHGLPRHLGQHSGGMVICQHALDVVVPLENSSMPGRSIIQWDKDDCEDLGIVKVDLLGLGMMAVLQDTIELCARHGRPVDLAHLPHDDAATYDMMCRADTIGVFQIESRAQMATLPRMQPRCFYDVAIEVAIIRPGPIEGGLMHPYLARRQGLEEVTYLDPRLEPVLERTLGICLFQEQVLKVAMVMADFTPSEADELRRALGFKRSDERLQRIEQKLRAAMAAKQATPECIEEVVKMTRSFALYGFPESHAVSFALLAYASTWLKCHRPAEFFASLLNNQPMGFYAPATLVQDARRHGLRILPVCVVTSGERCEAVVEGLPADSVDSRTRTRTRTRTTTTTTTTTTADEDAGAMRVEEEAPAYRVGAMATSAFDGPRPTSEGRLAGEEESGAPGARTLRLGLWQIQGLDRAHLATLVAERARRPFESLEDLRRRVPFSRDELRQLARAGALNALCGHRRAALWQVELPEPVDDLFSLAERREKEEGARAASDLEANGTPTPTLTPTLTPTPNPNPLPHADSEVPFSLIEASEHALHEPVPGANDDSASDGSKLPEESGSKLHALHGVPTAPPPPLPSSPAPPLPSSSAPPLPSSPAPPLPSSSAPPLPGSPAPSLPSSSAPPLPISPAPPLPISPAPPLPSSPALPLPSSPALPPSSFLLLPSQLRPMSPAERLAADFASQRLTTGRHPMHRVRQQLPEVWTAEMMQSARHGQHVIIAGNVICRQRPGTARGMVFVSLEDETGIANAIVGPQLFERVRLVLVEEPYLRISGPVSRRKGPPMVQARRVERLILGEEAGLGAAGSHDFH